MTLPTASVDRHSPGHGVHNLGARGLSIVNADSGSGIRLESLVSRCESQYEVRHERACIDPGSRVALCNEITIRCVQREVSAAPKAIVKEVAFNRWTNYARAKDVTEFNAAVKANVILRRDCQ